MKIKSLFVAAAVLALCCVSFTSCSKKINAVSDIIFTSGEWQFVMTDSSVLSYEVEGEKYSVPSTNRNEVVYNLIDPSGDGVFICEKVEYTGTLDCSAMTDEAFDVFKKQQDEGAQTAIQWNEKKGVLTTYSSGENAQGASLSVGAMRANFFPIIEVENYKSKVNGSSTSYACSYKFTMGEDEHEVSYVLKKIK